MIGILLINLGTPQAPTEEAVRQYLNVFLSDPYVITLPAFLRNFLVKKIILPKRPKISAHAYQQIWTSEGSPLLINSLVLKNKLSEKLGENYCVALGMRYNNPSIECAIHSLYEKKCDELIILPLFPQFSRATTQSALDVIHTVLQKKKYSPTLNIIHDFHDENAYIHSVACIIKTAWEKSNSDFLLLSYHGLPKWQKGAAHYRAQCMITSQCIAEKLNLKNTEYQVAFQSRLGFTKWLTPYTDHVLKKLRDHHIKKLSVACPSFVVDCIETLEEINIRLRAQWLSLGGESFHYIPCLNGDDHWINELANWMTR